MTKSVNKIIALKETAGIYLLKKKHPIIKQLRKTLPSPSIHGHKIWPSSYLIMHYLQENPIKKGSKVMEVGCGWGVLSIFCAKTFKAKVTGVDADGNVLPYMKVLAALNEVKVKTSEVYFEKIPKKTLAKQNVIIGSDICFWNELTDALYQMIQRAMKAGVKKIVIADPGRAPFLKLAKKCKRKYGAELIPCDVSWPQKAVGYLLVIENR